MQNQELLDLSGHAGLMGVSSVYVHLHIAKKMHAVTSLVVVVTAVVVEQWAHFYIENSQLESWPTRYSANFLIQIDGLARTPFLATCFNSFSYYWNCKLFALTISLHDLFRFPYLGIPSQLNNEKCVHSVHSVVLSTRTIVNSVFNFDSIMC